MSQISEDDIIFACFRNNVFELPFVVIADHRTGSIVVAIRGSISLRDIFTDLTAGGEKFEAEGLPSDTMAHKGMLAGAKYIKKRLDETGAIERAFAMYPHYDLIITGEFQSCFSKINKCLCRSQPRRGCRCIVCLDDPSSVSEIEGLRFRHARWIVDPGGRTFY